jgi:PAP_fibrillin
MTNFILLFSFLLGGHTSVGFLSIPVLRSVEPVRLSSSSHCWSAASHDIETGNQRLTVKSELLDLLKSTPSNAPTSRKLTKEILDKVDELERNCPTKDEDVIQSLAGNWELLWTAQDRQSNEWKRNPLRAMIKYVIR